MDFGGVADGRTAIHLGTMDDVTKMILSEPSLDYDEANERVSVTWRRGRVHLQMTRDAAVLLQWDLYGFATDFRMYEETGMWSFGNEKGGAPERIEYCELHLIEESDAYLEPCLSARQSPKPQMTWTGQMKDGQWDMHIGPRVDLWVTRKESEAAYLALRSVTPDEEEVFESRTVDLFPFLSAEILPRVGAEFLDVQAREP